MAATSVGNIGPKRALAVLMALTLTFSLCAGQPTPKAPEEPPKPARTPAGGVIVRFCDNSTLKMTLREDSLEIATRYGKLRIPIAEIQRIEFATRIPPEVLKRVDAAIVKLGHASYETREAASTELLGLCEQAYPALLKAAKSKDQEVVKRASELIEKIRESVSDEMLEFRARDVIHMADNSCFIGQIEGVAFKASTTAFGDVPLKYSAVHSLRAWGGEPEIDLAKLPPAPQHMANLAGMIGQTFLYRVTGTNMGGIFGTDVYTSDSHVATAAVHAGVVKVGETGLVRVTIVASPPGYVASERNGVRSNEYGAYNGAYKVSK